jgi:S-adenosylmethionine:tRNA ribosyltransferase-isomerase
MNALAFDLPSALEATAPAEVRGLARDQVRLMVAERATGAIEHARFDELPAYLDPGDLLVVNVSATLPAATAAIREDGSEARLHVSTRAPGLDATWRVVELRTADGARPLRPVTGERLILPDGGGELELVAPYAGSHARLMLARHDAAITLDEYLWRSAYPITYGYVDRRWPLSVYQNVYATTPGSAEMASAGRPFTPELITGLVAAGVGIAPVTLHAGVSSPERHEPPFPEYYEVPAATARLVAATRGWGGRVIAVGTTVVRALESAAAEHGPGAPGSGWTKLMITPDHELRAIDGLITGWHEPEASHLKMLEAIAGPELLARCYEAALHAGYLWHEFGDSHLILP